ncbi:MAG: integration host factor [Coriobacteriia bacterium]|nr:integration host factor [Coriobacteriia bacterium]
MALPQLSIEQRRENLELAAQVRQARAKVRADLKSGNLSLAEVLKRADEPAIQRMKVSALIEALPGYGKARAEKLMDTAGISLSRRVQGLGTRQYDALIKALLG